MVRVTERDTPAIQWMRTQRPELRAISADTHNWSGKEGGEGWREDIEGKCITSTAIVK